MCLISINYQLHFFNTYYQLIIFQGFENKHSYMYCIVGENNTSAHQKCEMSIMLFNIAKFVALNIFA